jgi:hypothetical protein
MRDRLEGVFGLLAFKDEMRAQKRDLLQDQLQQVSYPLPVAQNEGKVDTVAAPAVPSTASSL